jgi:hypothetical protein
MQASVAHLWSQTNAKIPIRFEAEVDTQIDQIPPMLITNQCTSYERRAPHDNKEENDNQRKDRIRRLTSNEKRSLYNGNNEISKR